MNTQKETIKFTTNYNNKGNMLQTHQHLLTVYKVYFSENLYLRNPPEMCTYLNSHCVVIQTACFHFI